MSASHKPRLLIIDDEPLVGSMLARLMKREYEVVTTTSAHEGLQLVVGQPWDAILCDIMMPELSGPEFLKKLHALDGAIVPKVGFMTGGAFDSATQDFLTRRGAGGWLAKPFTFERLQTFIEQLRTSPNE